MASPANELGAGGKFRRRPFRRIQPTPYDRPPAAQRGLRGGGHLAAERGGGGWISKFVDPASRLIANGASKLFASMFRKRLTAHAVVIPDEDRRSATDATQHASTILSSENQNGEIHNGGIQSGDIHNGVQNREMHNGRIQNGDSNGDNQTNNSDCGGMFELEQLFEQKTFTRVEFDCLKELLRSRTVESSNANHENNNEKKKGKAIVSLSEDIIGSSKVHEKLPVPSRDSTGQNQVPMIEASSPAEVAKAYMISKPSKVSSSLGSLRDQVFHEDTNLRIMPSASKGLDLSVAPRSVIRFSGIPEQPRSEIHAYQKAKPLGRTAMHRMSRSPYFNVNHAASFQVGEITRDGYSSPASSQWTPNSIKSPGNQALKRGGTALDDEYGSSGPIRRIRQKSNLMSTPRFSKSPMSVQKPLFLEERKLGSISLQADENGQNSTMLPMHSSEKAQKLFQQLDKLLPSPKEKSSELKTMTRDESPSELTLDMLHGSALRSMEHIGSSNFLNLQESSNADIAGDFPPNLINTPYKSGVMHEENSPSKKPAELGTKLKISEANGVTNATIPSKDARLDVRHDKISLSSSVALPVPKRPAFRISAPEDSLELDDDEDDNTNDVSLPSAAGSDTKISTHNDVISEATITEKTVSSSMLFKRDEKKAAIQPVITEKENGFSFPIASVPSTQSQPPPTPTMPTPQLDRQDVQKENTSIPTFSFGDKNVNISTVSTIIRNSVRNTEGIKVGEESGSKVGLNTSTTSNSAEESTIAKSEAQKTGDVFKSSETTPAACSFGASSPSLSNGSLNPSSLSAFSVSSDSIFGNNNSTNSSSNNSPVSSAAATFSTTSAPVVLTQPLDTSKSNTVEANLFKVSLFSMPSSMTQDASSMLPSSSMSSTTSTSSLLFSKTSGSSSSFATSSAFPSTTSGIFGFSASTQSIGSSPSFATTSSVFGASNGSTSSSTLFTSSSSQNSTPVTFGATDNSSSQKSSAITFGANNSSSQHANVIGATDNNSPKPAASTFGATDNSSQKPATISFGVTDNNSQKPAASTFDATNGSIFGTQSTQIGTQNTQISQSSTSQFGSFSPPFGLSNSSSSSFGISPFGSTSFNSSGASFSSSSKNLPFASIATPSIFGSTSQAPTSSIFASTTSGNSASTIVFGSSTSGSSTSPFTFGSSSGSNASPFTFGSSSGSSSSPFTFGSSASGSTSTPLTFNSSSSSTAAPFAFGSSSSSTVSTPVPAFGIQKPEVGYGTNFPGNDQMSVEDNMTDVSNQAPAPSFPTFGQPPNPTTTPGFAFGSAPQPNTFPTFQFGGAQNPSVAQNTSLFQPTGSLDFNPGGSFSLGSGGGGGDKSGRKIIKVKRAPRKK